MNTFSPQARTLIQSNTTRSNFVLFSIYVTNLDVPALSFKAEVESIGVLNSFYTYKVP
jgi:hypothetical protein